MEINEIFESIQNNVLKDAVKSKSLLNYLVKNTLLLEARELRTKILELHPEEEKNIAAFDEGKMFCDTLGMVGIRTDIRQSHLILQSAKLFIDKGDELTLSDTSKLQADNNKIFRLFES